MKLFFSLLFFSSTFALAESSSLSVPPSPQLKSASIMDSSSTSLTDSSGFEVKLISPYKQIKKGSSFLVGIQIKMQEDWYTYWSFAGDFGIAPHINFKTTDKIQIKTLPLPRPQRKDLSLEGNAYYSFIYEQELLIPLDAFVQNSYDKDNLELKLNLEWGLCKDVCLNKISPLELNLAIGTDFKEDPSQKIIFDFWKDRFPQKPELIQLNSSFSESDSKQILSFSFEPEIKCLDAFPKSRLDFSTKKPKRIQQTENSCSFEFTKSEGSLNTLSGLLIYSQNGQIQSSWFVAQKEEKLALIWFILMAFLGGLILNVMPCVLPIIFLKFYNNLQIKSFSRKKQFLLNGSYSLGVILSFLILALIIFMAKKSGESLGWGFHLQSPLFVNLLALLFTLMGFYLLDLFSLSIPKLPKLFKEEKILSHFLTGVLSTTAASPCTVPFMASAVGFAFSRTYLEIFAIFFFLGLGLSSPYLLLSFFPQVFKYIPSPGAWSQTLKKLFSIPLFLTSLWLLSILYLQLELKVFILSLLVFPVLVGGVFITKQSSKPILKKVSALSSASFILIVLALQTPFHSSKENPISKKEALLKRGFNWQNFDENKIVYNQRQSKNIFIAFGAEWCLTCQFNDRLFKTKSFQEVVDQYNIQLFYGDWTNKTDSITSFLEKYSRQGVPFYIFYQGEDKAFIFPTLLTENSLLEKLKELAQ